MVQDLATQQLVDKHLKQISKMSKKELIKYLCGLIGILGAFVLSWFLMDNIAFPFNWIFAIFVVLGFGAFTLK